MSLVGAKPILLGRIVGAHGIRGEVLVKTYTSVPEDIAAYGPLTSESGARRFDVTVVRVTAKGVIVRISGIADRTAAEALNGMSLYLDRERLPAPAAEEFYHDDLIGLAVVSPAGETLGEVVGVQNYGAGDLIEVRLAGTHSTELVPFSAAFVPEVDLANRRLVVLPSSSED
jgi:16S rRNA processing protein RimM